MIKMSIALTNLGKYNEGILDFAWLNLPASDDEIAAAFDKIEVSHDDVHYYSDGEGHATGNGMFGEYEEFFITDYECDFMNIDEYANLDELNELAERLNDMDEWQAELLEGILENVTSDPDEALNDLDDVIEYPDCYDMADVAEYYINELGGLEVPEYLQNYIDYEAFGRDMSYDGHWFSYNGGMACIPY